MSRILIVDDSPTDTYVARKCAEALFSEVRSVGDAEGVFKELQDYPPDLCLMDVSLFDVKNGISIISEIRELEGGSEMLPIVVCSARSTPADKMIAANAGASFYIVKPITPEALAEAVAAVRPGLLS